MIQQTNNGVRIIDFKLLSIIQTRGVKKLGDPRAVYMIATSKMAQYRYSHGTYEFWRTVYRIALNQLECA